MHRPLPTLLLVLALAAPAAAADPPAEEPAPAVVGAPAAFGLSVEERLPVPAGTRLHELPDARSPALAVLDAASELVVVERHGPWVRVRYGALLGWVEGRRGPGGPAPELDPPSPASPRRLSEAEEEVRRGVLAWVDEHLGAAAAAGPEADSLGPWTLRTDVTDRRLLAFLDRLAAELPRAYRERYGLDPGSAEGEVVVLFARETDYRALSRRHASLVGIGEEGHAGRGVAVLFVGDRARDDVAALLVHELTHLLNGRTLGLRTPPWLEEGLADDLAFSRIDPEGRLAPGTLAGGSRETGRVALPDGRTEIRLRWEGGRGALRTLIQHQERGELPSPESVAHLSWQGLVDPARRAVTYAASTFFVRYLLAGEDAGAFRRYLRFLAAGGGDDPAELVAILGRDWSDLDRGFRRWLRAGAASLSR